MNALPIGLLPLYVKLYDEVLPDLLTQMAPFLERVRAELAGAGLAVSVAPTARTEAEVAAAVARFESSGVDAIVTLHLAYSPSLESASVLARTPLPLLMLDTTPNRDFGRHVDPNLLLFNHGIHGVQDLASVLRRKRKPFRVIAGHLDDPEVLPRCVEALRGARAARCLRAMRVLRVGGLFPGMGDFAVPDACLESAWGIKIENITPDDLKNDVTAVREQDLAAEVSEDATRFTVECPKEVHERSARIGLGLRAYLNRGSFGAFSLNFSAFRDPFGPVSSVPFLECCKAMARGIGYAGEGDALTAALVGALLQGFGAATFVEMFCADWQGETLFLSHMGEINPAEAAERPLLYEKDFPFTPALNPATLACALRPGTATYVNLAPGPEGSFRLITAEVEVLPDGTHPNLRQWVRSWVRPSVRLPRFLEEFSHLGGTHHGALVPGRHRAALDTFCTFLKIEHCPIT